MVKIEKSVSYYQKKKLYKTSKIESLVFYNLEDALQAFQEMEPRYYINLKDITAIETIKLLYSATLGVKILYKTINVDTEEIETNNKE